MQKASGYSSLFRSWIILKRGIDFLDGVNILGLPIDNTGKRYIPLMAGDVLKVGALANLSSGKTCWVQASGNDYQ